MRTSVDGSEISADFGAFVDQSPCARDPTGRGALSGLTFAVKDFIDVAGCRTGGGSPDWLASHAAAAVSAPAVEALLGAGAQLIGKTNMDELAFSLEGANAHYGTPVNPACPDRLPGGSSSGSAVAVAAGLVDFALGTDTGGSVRTPASFTGIFGFRPTHGRVSTVGVAPFAPSYDTIGWLARDPGCLSRVGRVLLLGSGDAAPINRLVQARDAFAFADPAAATVLRARARAWGAVDEVTVFDGAEAEWFECYRVLQGAEIWRCLGPWITANRPRFGEEIAPRFADAATIGEPDVTRYRAFRQNIAARLRAMIPPGTGLVIPTTLGAALPLKTSPEAIGSFYKSALPLNAIAGHPGLPQVAIPILQQNACPLGLSIVGAASSDEALLDLAISLHKSET
ncbi:amidase [Methylocapsa acidiphila]|uniref:amidase n=1 Tax=Methylocapsa acidiphila TaxID=133552 RepID=UPI0003F6C5E8|nr:amidase [Methylocapsa acidiphila]